MQCDAMLYAVNGVEHGTYRANFRDCGLWIHDVFFLATDSHSCEHCKECD